MALDMYLLPFNTFLALYHPLHDSSNPHGDIARGAGRHPVDRGPHAETPPVRRVSCAGRSTLRQLGYNHGVRLLPGLGKHHRLLPFTEILSRKLITTEDILRLRIPTIRP